MEHSNGAENGSVDSNVYSIEEETICFHIKLLRETASKTQDTDNIDNELEFS